MEKVAIKKQQSRLLRHFIAFLRRFHLILFFIFVAGCVAFGVIVITATLDESALDDSTTSSNSLDEATLDKIESLHSSSAPLPTPQLPSGRVNPFAE